MIWDVDKYLIMDNGPEWLAPVVQSSVYQPLVKNEEYLGYLQEKWEKRQIQQRASDRRRRGTKD